MPDPNDAVRALLQEVIATGPEVGLQVAAYLDGELVIDAWAGLADQATGTTVDGETLFMVSTTTKGVTATCMHRLAELGAVAYDDPIVKYWPEFGAHGKDQATIRDALTHRTGIPQTPVGYTADWLTDWPRMCEGIASLRPMFAPGERTAYHSTTFGHVGRGGTFGYADPSRRFALALAKNYYAYSPFSTTEPSGLSDGRTTATIVADGVFQALGWRHSR
jgi:CubicO group peptidase (beta-lactamase class C family)